MRRPLLLVSLCTFAFSAFSAPKFNVLMIAIDDMRPQLGCYGDPTVKSPNMDRLAARGLLFRRAYCQQALCSPSRISLLSGRFPVTTKIFTIGPDLRSTMPDITTLPQHFKNNGYFTRSLGKVYHVGIDDPASWSVPSWQSKKPRVGPVGEAARERRRAEYAATGTRPPQKGQGSIGYATPAFEAPEVGDDDLLDGDTAREGVGILRDLAKKPAQPFFLAVGFANPHVPWVAPKKYWDLYDPAKIPMAPNQFLPRNAPAFAAKSGDDFYWYGNVPKDRNLPEEFKRQCLHGYLAAISYVDAQVGRLLDTLESTGLAKNTVVILWSDHGYYMGEHSWWGGKHNNYEGATRATLMLAVPGHGTQGAKTDALVQFVDIAPSLTELCGLPREPGFEGRSFVPLLADPKGSINEAAFNWYPKGSPDADGNTATYLGCAMRTGRWRYVEWVNDELKIIARELYDEQSDPQENENVAGKPENREVLGDLETTMRTLRGAPVFGK
jgi:iduronate 2-sulfatase